jgi:hypothetical protein
MIKTDITLAQRIAISREYARQTALDYGSRSPEHAVAADNLEELLAASAHNYKHLNSLERFCTENPGAQQCSIHDN